MDLSAELLKMLEARSHPRFVRLVVWAAGLGIIAGALLLVGQAVAASVRASAAFFHWAQAYFASGALARSHLVSQALDAAVGWVISVCVLWIVYRFVFMPRLNRLRERAEDVLKKVTVKTENGERLSREIQASHAELITYWGRLKDRLYEAHARGIDVDDILPPAPEPESSDDEPRLALTSPETRDDS